MEGKRFFEIPNDPEVMALLVEAVPPNWRWMSGGLSPNDSLIASGRVQGDTGFTLQRFHDIHPTIVGVYDKIERRRKAPNFYALMVEQKLPGFVLFDDAGLDCTTLPLGVAKQIAAGFIRKGYHDGCLSFWSNDHDNNMDENPARCNLVLRAWQGGSFNGEEGPQPARIRLDWKSQYGGSEEDVAPIVAVCRQLGLREYTPAASATVPVP